MRDFDADRAKRDRTFKIMGQEFVTIDVRPEVFADLEDREASAATAAEALNIADERIKMFLATDEMREKWDELRKVEDSPITTADMTGIRRWFLEVHTGRPFVPLAPSSPGPGSSAASSTVDDSSPAEDPEAAAA